MEAKQNFREGHRGRVKARFLREGLEKFADYEVLEFLLFYAVPRKDTKGMAHALIDTFSSLGGVLRADMESLCAVSGIGAHAAAFLRGILPFAEYLIKQEERPPALSDKTALAYYFFDHYELHEKKTVTVVFFNNRYEVIGKIYAEEEKLTETAIAVGKVIEYAYQLGASGVAVGYYKKDGIPIPTSDALAVLRRLQLTLADVGLQLYDIFCITPNQYNSLMEFSAGELRQSDYGNFFVRRPNISLHVQTPALSVTRLKEFLFLCLTRERAEAVAERLLCEPTTLFSLVSLPYDYLISHFERDMSVILLLKLVLSTYSYEKLERAKRERKRYDTAEKLGELFLDVLGTFSNEVVCLALLDDTLRLIDAVLFFGGTVNTTGFATRSLVEHAVKKKATYVAMAHNHPSGRAIPSNADITSTCETLQVFRDLRFFFLDHFVVNEREYGAIAATNNIETDAPNNFYSLQR